jgi:hypothetical protein
LLASIERFAFGEWCGGRKKKRELPENQYEVAMRSLTPKDYRCPFFRLAAGKNLSGEFSNQDDIVFQDSILTAFISSAW